MDLGAISMIKDNKANVAINDKGIEVVSCTLEDLFKSQNHIIPGSNIIGNITIPEYQRPYKWRERQINKLLNDLVEYKKITENKPLYYLGSIIIHQDGEQLKIIDGQQRLTTMLILNSVLKFIPFPNIIYQSPTSIQNIKYNHNYIKAIFNKEIVDFQDITKEDIIDFSTINITLIVTNSEDLAYTFFETQNTGGVRLNGTDIAKAHHLRAISSKKLVAHQAKKWESIDSIYISECIKNLIKIRYWNNRKWKTFPLYREERRIKESIIQEFTEKTMHDNKDIAYYYSVVKKENTIAYQQNESYVRQIRQPLHDGNNFMDFINEYVNLHQVLFKNDNDYRVSDSFYKFRDCLLHGKDGTVFLKELTEISIVTYVSRFGFTRLFEFSLWVYRYIYSMRVSFNRNVREDSIFKFVFDHYLIDTILESYTIDELIKPLKRFSYSFDKLYTEDNQSKAKHVIAVKKYFSKFNIDLFTSAREMYTENIFDKALIKSIQLILIQSENHD